MAEDKKPPNTMGDITNNRGIITQGQQGNNTLNISPRYAEIGDATIQDIKKLFPTGSRVMVTRAIQDGPTAAMAAKIHTLMIALGY